MPGRIAAGAAAGQDGLWSERLNALAHPARLEILRYLSRQNDCYCRDVVSHLPLAQSTVSQHLKVLVDAGLVDTRHVAQHSLYNLNEQALLSISRAVTDLVGSCCASNCCGGEKK